MPLAACNNVWWCLCCHLSFMAFKSPATLSLVQQVFFQSQWFTKYLKEITSTSGIWPDIELFVQPLNQNNNKDIKCLHCKSYVPRNHQSPMVSQQKVTIMWKCHDVFMQTANLQIAQSPFIHDDVIKWKDFPRYCGEFIGHRWIPLTKASDSVLCCFLWSAHE